MIGQEKILWAHPPHLPVLFNIGFHLLVNANLLRSKRLDNRPPPLGVRITPSEQYRFEVSFHDVGNHPRFRGKRLIHPSASSPLPKDDFIPQILGNAFSHLSTVRPCLDIHGPGHGLSSSRGGASASQDHLRIAAEFSEPGTGQPSLFLNSNTTRQPRQELFCF